MRRSVHDALQHWLGEGLLTSEQVQELSESFEKAEKPRESGRLVLIFGTIGAVLTGLGVILFVASNWATMSPGARTVVLLAVYGAVVAGAVFAERRDLSVVADALWLLSTLVLGANIFLMAQTYNLSLTLWQGTLAWMIGALAMGWARQSPPQAGVAVPLGLLTIGWAGGGSGWFFDDQFEFLFADDGLRPVLGLVGLALISLSTLVAKRDDLRFAQVPCFRWGTFIVAAVLILTTVHVELASAMFDADFSTKQIVLIAAAIALIAAAAGLGKLESAASRPAMIGILVVLLAVMIPSGDTIWLGIEAGGVHLLFGLYVVFILSMALLTIWLGINARNARLVNLGMVSTTLLIIIQYFGWSFELLDRSIAFILGGIVLITLSVFVEQQRRRIMAQIAT